MVTEYTVMFWCIFNDQNQGEKPIYTSVFRVEKHSKASLVAILKWLIGHLYPWSSYCTINYARPSSSYPAVCFCILSFPPSPFPDRHFYTLCSSKMDTLLLHVNEDMEIFLSSNYSTVNIHFLKDVSKRRQPEY